MCPSHRDISTRSPSVQGVAAALEAEPSELAAPATQTAAMVQVIPTVAVEVAAVRQRSRMTLLRSLPLVPVEPVTTSAMELQDLQAEQVGMAQVHRGVEGILQVGVALLQQRVQALRGPPGEQAAQEQQRRLAPMAMDATEVDHQQARQETATLPAQAPIATTAEPVRVALHMGQQALAQTAAAGATGCSPETEKTAVHQVPAAVARVAPV